MNQVPPSESFADRSAPEIDSGWLRLDAEREVTRIADAVRNQVLRRLRRRGIVLGLSGGIDSSVCAALAVAALGAKMVLGLLMPERDSEADSLRLGKLAADSLGIETVTEDIAPILYASGCYARRDAFIRKLVPEYGEGWGCKVVLTGGAYNLTQLVVQCPAGEQRTMRMPLDVYLGVVAATNMKQRTRKQLEYFHADRLNYAVLGTPNRLEYDQGFFVKNGDGAADVKPLAHLYKGQVYQLAEHLGLPEEIRSRPPTTDTWSLAQSQEEFYFSVPYPVMDVCLFGLENGIAAEEVAARAKLTIEQVEQVWRDIKAKRAATRYLHEPPLLVEPVLHV
jgi:NAD+ synthase